MHSDAARGNEENGYMIGGNFSGLYYNHEAYQQREERQEELRKIKEAKSDTAKFKSLLHAAENGDSRSGYELAVCYKLGIGVEQNDSLAFKWLRLAAEGGVML